MRARDVREQGRRGIEPWPVAVMALLAAMIAACLAFWAVAVANPDPVVGDAWSGSPRAEAVRAAEAAQP